MVSHAQSTVPVAPPVNGKVKVESSSQVRSQVEQEAGQLNLISVNPQYASVLISTLERFLVSHAQSTLPVPPLINSKVKVEESTHDSVGELVAATGDRVGDAVGDLVGAAVGGPTGATDGVADGLIDSVGLFVGDSLGSVVGTWDGFIEGDTLGMSLGSLVGIELGFLLG